MSRLTPSVALIFVCFLGSLSLAAPAGEMWKDYLRLSQVCLAGKFTSVTALSDEAGVNYYRCEMDVEQVIAGFYPHKKITLSFVRIESKAEELPFLKGGEKCIVFLKTAKTKLDFPYVLANVKWGLQPYSEELAKQIGDAQERRKADSGKTESGGDARAQKERRKAFALRAEKGGDELEEQFVGKWHLTMPAGFEYEANLQRAADEKPGIFLYRLTTEATNLAGIYDFHEGRLTLVVPVAERMEGLGWEIKNKNVILLVEHPESANVGPDYLNASLTRK